MRGLLAGVLVVVGLQSGVANATINTLASPTGCGVTNSLFRDCALRVARAADTIGIRGIVVHAISEQAKAFYQALSFDPSLAEPMTLMVTLADIRQLSGE